MSLEKVTMYLVFALCIAWKLSSTRDFTDLDKHIREGTLKTNSQQQLCRKFIDL